MTEILIVLSIVGCCHLFNEAIGRPLAVYEPTAIFSCYTDFICKLIIRRNNFQPKGSEQYREDNEAAENIYKIARLDQAKPYIGKLKWLLCGYCISTRIAFFLIPFWIYNYGIIGILYFGTHLFFNIYLSKTQ